MALYHKWDVKNDFTNLLQFFLLISDGLGGVLWFVVNMVRDHGTMFCAPTVFLCTYSGLRLRYLKASINYGQCFSEFTRIPEILFHATNKYLG